MNPQEKIDRYFRNELFKYAKDWKSAEYVKIKTELHKEKYELVLEIAKDLSDLSNEEIINIENEAEEYISLLYGDDRINEINKLIEDARYEMDEYRASFTYEDIKAGQIGIKELDEEKQELIKKAKEIDVFKFWRTEVASNC